MKNDWKQMVEPGLALYERKDAYVNSNPTAIIAMMATPEIGKLAGMKLSPEAHKMIGGFTDVLASAGKSGINLGNEPQPTHPGQKQSVKAAYHLTH